MCRKRQLFRLPLENGASREHVLALSGAQVLVVREDYLNPVRNMIGVPNPAVKKVSLTDDTDARSLCGEAGDDALATNLGDPRARLCEDPFHWISAGGRMGGARLSSSNGVF